MCHIGDKKGENSEFRWIHLPSDKIIKSLEEADSNQYLGVLEADEVTVNEMRDKVKKEYYKRVINKCWKQS